MKDDFKDFDEAFFDLASHAGKKSYASPKKRDTSTTEVTSETNGTPSSPEKGFRVPPAGRDSAPSRQIRTAKYSGASFNRGTSRRTEEKSAAGHVIREYDVNGEFIKHITVKSWPVGYSFYEKFVRDAAVSHEKRGKKAPHVPFFSYIPQYSQLNASQWAYYLYMKECAAEGVCLGDADFSYVILYIYEIINLEGIIPPEKGAVMLATVWMLYRRIHPMLDKYMSEWMADYCLLYALPLPKVLFPVLAELSRGSTVKEFFAEGVIKHTPKEAGRLMRFTLSDYNASKSRYASKLENFVTFTEDVFDCAVLEQLRDRSGVFSDGLRRHMTVTRDAFCGSLCAASVKKKIILELDTPFRAPETRRVVTEMMKGAENIVRSRLGVKARLSAPVLEGKSAAVTARSAEELSYLSFYESPSDTLSAESAAKIEEESWRNTELLAGDELTAEEDFAPDVPEIEGALSGGDSDTAEQEVMPSGEKETVNNAESLPQALGAKLYGLLRVSADGGSFADACRAAGMFADEAARRINECAMDLIGDVVLESHGTDYVFIEDYREDIE